MPRLAEAFTDAKVTERTTTGKAWLPSRADPADDKNIPFGLDAAFTKDTGKGTRFLAAVSAPVADPNNRNVHMVYKFDDPSPLSSSERGVVSESSHIAMPKVAGVTQQPLTRSLGRVKHSSKETDEPLLLQVNNLSEDCMEIYIQRALVMQLSTLRPNMKCERCLTDTRAQKKAPRTREEPSATSLPLAVLFANVSKISAVITGRHEVRAFHFQPRQIGIEVEMLYQRLICTRVVPDSQAHIYENALNGSEILSVNGVRVMTLEEFQHAVVAAYASGSVVIGAAAYRNIKHKKDFAHFIGSTKVEFKSLLSNMMRSGIDKDHQHDIGPNNKADENDDSDSESDESSAPPAEDAKSGEAEAKDDHAQANEEDENQKEDSDNERQHHSDSDSDDGNIVSIRKAPSNRTYVGLDDSEDGMMVAGRRINDQDSVQYSPRDEKDIILEPQEEQNGLELDIEEDDNEQQVIEINAVVGHDQRPLIVHEAKETWDYTTALELEEAIPFSTIVCVPRLFEKSLVSRQQMLPALSKFTHSPITLQFNYIGMG